jgi:hypothetical protein
VYVLDPATKLWAHQRVFAAYTRCNSNVSSVKFDALGERIVTAMYGDNPDSAIKVFGVSSGLCCHGNAAD